MRQWDIGNAKWNFFNRRKGMGNCTFKRRRRIFLKPLCRDRATQALKRTDVKCYVDSALLNDEEALDIQIK